MNKKDKEVVERSPERGGQQIDQSRVSCSKSNDEFVDEVMDQAGGMGRFHLVFYLGIGVGINSIGSWLYYQIPFLI